MERAIAHKLNLTAASLIDSGEIYVELKNSLDKVQQVMTESGWGQIPVIDKKNGEIVGIVTRTDLLKAIGKPKTTVIDKKNLSIKLNSALPKAQITLLESDCTTRLSTKKCDLYRRRVCSRPHS